MWLRLMQAVSVELAAPGSRWVDLDPVRFTADGHGRSGSRRRVFEYPAACFVTAGSAAQLFRACRSISSCGSGRGTSSGCRTARPRAPRRAEVCVAGTRRDRILMLTWGLPRSRVRPGQCGACLDLKVRVGLTVAVALGSKGTAARRRHHPSRRWRFDVSACRKAVTVRPRPQIAPRAGSGCVGRARTRPTKPRRTGASTSRSDCIPTTVLVSSGESRRWRHGLSFTPRRSQTVVLMPPQFGSAAGGSLRLVRARRRRRTGSRAVLRDGGRGRPVSRDDGGVICTRCARRPVSRAIERACDEDVRDARTCGNAPAADCARRRRASSAQRGAPPQTDRSHYRRVRSALAKRPRVDERCSREPSVSRTGRLR